MHHPDVITFIDSPPGTSCLVMETLAGADYCLLVSEPTLFGAHNLAMVHELVTLMKIPAGVILNKVQGGDDPSERYCLDHEIPVLGRIPFDRRLGLLNSEGRIAAQVDPAYRTLFSNLLTRLIEEASV